jgi:tetratricopeptide (TPR) repeat protein
VIDAETGEMKNILKDAGWPAWSPDGKWIAGLYAGENEAEKIIIISPDGKQKKVLVDLSEEENLSLGGYPVWAPDSRSIIYIVGANEDKEGRTLYMVDLEGNEKEIAEMVLAIAFLPAISPDGKSIAFVKGREIAEGEEGGEEAIVELILMNLETGEERILNKDSELIVTPSFSPDGRFLAYRFAGMDEEEEEAGISLIKILSLEEEEERIIAVNSYEMHLLCNYYLAKGQGLIEAGEEEKGRQFMQKALDISVEYMHKYSHLESLQDVLAARATSFKELGRLDEAVSQFKLLLALYEYRSAGKAGILQAKFEMAGCYQALKKKSEAIQIYEQIVSEIPEDTKDEHLKELRQKAAAKLEEPKPKEP